jgi:hypothetical protein
MMSLGTIGQDAAWPMLPDLRATTDDMVVHVRDARGGAKAGTKSKSVNTNVNRNANANVNVNRNKNVNANANVNRSANVNVVRPVRVWAPRPYYGTIIGGVALGTAILVATAGTAPAAPAPNLFWFWSDATNTGGYWDYCVAPR